MEGKVIIKTFASEIEAKVAKLKLEESGIVSWILNKKDSSYLTFGEIELYINEEDTDKAKTLLK